MEAKKQNKKRALTGDRPTGKLHLGHFVGSLQTRLELQNEAEQFVMVADVQALTDNAHNPDKISEHVREVVLDNLAVGLDPTKTTFFIQSQVPHIAELTIFFLNLVTLARLKRNPTVKNEMNLRGYAENGNVPAGFLMYPVSQAADILFCKADIVPVGEDQLPMIEQTNEIVRKFNTLYGNVFNEVEGKISGVSRLSGIDGKGKMSKTLGNAIYLSDSPEELEKKVMQMYTDPKHIKKEDPGNIEGNTVFEYLSIFDSNQSELAELQESYKKGGIGDVEVKKRLIQVLDTTLDPIRQRREELSKDKDSVMDILKEGSLKAREIGEVTLGEVKNKIKINYFSN